MGVLIDYAIDVKIPRNVFGERTFGAESHLNTGTGLINPSAISLHFRIR